MESMSEPRPQDGTRSKPGCNQAKTHFFGGGFGSDFGPVTVLREDSVDLVDFFDLNFKLILFILSFNQALKVWITALATAV